LGVIRSGYAEGLIEFLQAIAPEWATKLTMERLSFIRELSERDSRVGVLKAENAHLREMLNRVLHAGARLARAEDVVNSNGYVVVPHGETLAEARALLADLTTEKDSPDGN
jgi:hypothetical protein